MDEDSELPEIQICWIRRQCSSSGGIYNRFHGSNERHQKRRYSEMNEVMKGMILVLMILYIVSPIDACPGPIDDLIILFIGLAARKQIASNE